MWKRRYAVSGSMPAYSATRMATTSWIHDVVAMRVAEYAGIDPDTAYLLFHTAPPAGYELRGYLGSLAEVASYIEVIPSEYVAIVPTGDGWAVYVF